MQTTIHRITAALISTIMIALLMAPAANAQEDTFACDPGFYQVIAGQFAQFDPGAGTYDTLGPDNSNYNAMGYRIADGYMYALAGSSLYRINAFGDLSVVAKLEGSSGGYTGDFGDDGLLHVSRGGAAWTTINVDTLEANRVPELSISTGTADVANVNGIFYGLSSSGDLIRIDPVALTVDNVGPVQGVPAGSMAYGAAWSTAGGNLYVGRNSGEIFQITGYSTSSPEATQVGTAPPTNSNDGASCALAPPPAGLADVDGPEPETEPSTPEAKAAAKEYEETYEPTPLPEPTNDPSDPEPESTNPEETYAVEADAIQGGDTCGASPIEARPPREALQQITMVDFATTLYSSGFDDASAIGWRYLSGDWSMSDGMLKQTADCDFDATALLTTHTVSDFRWSTSFVANQGRNNGGLLFHQSSTNTRSGATLVDFADNGSVIRWGSYDNAGFYQYGGMQELAPVAPGQLVRLSVKVNGTFVEVSVDDVAVAYFQAPESGGMVGLVATKSALSFDHAELVALPAEFAQAAEDEEQLAEEKAADEAAAERAPAEEATPGEAAPAEGDTAATPEPSTEEPATEEPSTGEPVATEPEPAEPAAVEPETAEPAPAAETATTEGQ